MIKLRFCTALDCHVVFVLRDKTRVLALIAPVMHDHLNLCYCEAVIVSEEKH